MSIVKTRKTPTLTGPRRGPRDRTRPAGTAQLATTFDLPARASLLPQEVGIRKRAAALRRRALGVLVLVLLVVVAACGGAWLYAQNEQLKLAAAQAEAIQLQRTLSNYSPIKQVQSDIATGIAASKVGGSTDIEWGPYFALLQGTLPAGVALADIKASSADILSEFSQPALGSATPRVASISFTATSTSLPDIPSWINALSALPGFLDAQPGGVTQTTGIYTATVTMDVSAEAFSYRFLPKTEKASK